MRACCRSRLSEDGLRWKTASWRAPKPLPDGLGGCDSQGSADAGSPQMGRETFGWKGPRSLQTGKHTRAYCSTARGDIHDLCCRAAKTSTASRPSSARRSDPSLTSPISKPRNVLYNYWLFIFVVPFHKLINCFL